MGFYDLNKEQRQLKYLEIQDLVEQWIECDDLSSLVGLFNDDDTYIRKAGYLAIGKIYQQNPALRIKLIAILEELLVDNSPLVSQSVIQGAGEIAKKDFLAVEAIFIKGLDIPSHFSRNALTGALKKAGERNPQAVIDFVGPYLNTHDPEVRRLMVHGLELRGRTHPQEILPLLRQMQFEKHKRVRPMVIHIFGQISYKKGCLDKVLAELLTWDDEGLVKDCLEEVIGQHYHINQHFKTINTLSGSECESYIKEKWFDGKHKIYA